MVNYHDPATIAQEVVAVLKFWHVMYGIYIWEFFNTLDFEWDFIRGRRPYRWTIWIYSLARVAALANTILEMVGLDTTTPINCQAWISIGLLFGYISFATASLLIALRVIAIWNRAKIIFAISTAILLAEASVLLYGLIRIRATWSPYGKACAILNFESTEPAVMGSLATDLLLLLLMLLGLLRMRSGAAGGSSIGHFLWKQGLIWLLIATVIEVPPVVLIILNLNVPLNLVSQVPYMIIVTIATTRMYRSLVNFGSSDILHQTPGGTGTAVSEMGVCSGPITLDQMEMTVHTEHEQYGTSQVTRCVSTDMQGRYKAYKASLNGEEESGLEK